MNSINTVIIGGNLTKAPERIQAQSGVELAKTSLAINEHYGDNETTSFIDVTAFKHQAKFLCDYCDKGDYVIVEGRIQQDRWQNKDGQNRSKIVVIANRVTGIPRTDKEQAHDARQGEYREDAPEPATSAERQEQHKDIPF